MADSESQMSRLDEKHELIHLNSRLETYVTHTSTVTADRDRLVAEAKHWRQEYQKLLVSSSDLYEKDTTALKRKIVTLEKNLAKSEQARKELEEQTKVIKPLEDEVDKLKDQLQDAVNRVKDLEDKIKHITHKYNSELEITDVLRKKVDQLEGMGNDNDHTINTVTRERDAIIKEYHEVKEALETEVLNLKNEYADQLMGEKARWEIDWSAKMRKLEDDLKKNWEDATENMRKRIADLEETNARLLNRAEVAEGEFSKQENFVKELIAKLNKLDVKYGSQSAKLREEIKALEETLEAERRSRAKKDDDFNKLMDLKISLQTELDKYRVILEREEERVGLTPGSEGPKSVFGSPESVLSPAGSDYSGVSGKRRKRARRSVTGHRARQVMKAIEVGGDPHDALDGSEGSDGDEESGREKGCKVM